MLKVSNDSTHKLIKNDNDKVAVNIQIREARVFMTILTLSMVAFFENPQGWGVLKCLSLPKICNIYPIMMNPDTVIPCLNEIQNIYK